jgi:hypothetical protein
MPERLFCCKKALRTAGAILILCSLVWSQQMPPVLSRQGGKTTRSIVGKVLNSSGAPVAGAAVLIKNTSTLQIRSYLAAADGTYHFYGLSSDINYELRAEANGLTSKTRMVSVFDSHPIINVNLALKKKIKF